MVCSSSPEHLLHHLELKAAEKAVRVDEDKTEMTLSMADGLIEVKDRIRQLFDGLNQMLE